MGTDGQLPESLTLIEAHRAAYCVESDPARRTCSGGPDGNHGGREDQAKAEGHGGEHGGILAGALIP